MAKRGRKGKAIVACNPDGSLNGWFEALTQAEDIYHLTRSRILKSIRTGEPYKGFRWVWKTDYDDAMKHVNTERFAFKPRKDRNLMGWSRPGYHWKREINEKKEMMCLKARQNRAIAYGC